MKYKIIKTCAKSGLLWQESEIESQEPEWINLVILYPCCKRQTIKGFGGSFTEAAGNVLSSLSDKLQQEVLEWYFGYNGLRYTLCRTHMNSCDFSLGNYACIDDPADTDLESFSLEREEKYILPMIRKANEISAAPVKLLLSPWSPPAFMKTNCSMNNGGQLKKEYYNMWADCIVRYIKEYRTLGLDVALVSVQNEPAAVQPWDSCIYSAEEEAAFVRDHLGPKLESEGLGDVGILIWDHNKDLIYSRASRTLDDALAAKYIAGIAFHWYSGDHFEAVRMVNEKFPDKTLYFTEGCVEYSRFSDADAVSKAEIYAHDIIGNLGAGTAGSIDWNLVLDKKGGPNYAGNFCEAPVMCEALSDTAERKLSYYYIGHFSRYIKPGAQRIVHSSYCSEVESAAFINLDGERVAVLLNRTEKPLAVSLCEDTQLACSFILEPHTIVTICYST